jgi:hypothetical protein
LPIYGVEGRKRGKGRNERAPMVGKGREKRVYAERETEEL